MPDTPTPTPSSNSPVKVRTWHWERYLKWLIGFFLASILVGALFVAALFMGAARNLPPIEALKNYKPKLPLRVYTADNYFIGEFGEEKREFAEIEKIPKIMQHAVIAIEDERFYRHKGVDLTGIARAAVSNLSGHHAQGASTITMQLARNFFLSRERTFNRKIYEILLAYKIESNMSKEKILELYLNEIYLGQQAYGFPSAAKAYFGKPIAEITIAEAAMLAGLPKAPSAYNPVVNPKRAKIRQEYILQRMLEQAYITKAQYDEAMQQQLVILASKAKSYDTNAQYVAEQVRSMLFNFEESKGSILGDKIYSKGISVYTTILKADQDAAYQAVQKAIRDYDRRQGYRGPESFIDLPSNPTERQDALDDALNEYPDTNGYISAVVLSASPRHIKAIRQNGDVIEVDGDGLRLANYALSAQAPSKLKIRPGALIRLNYIQNHWYVSQLPEVQSAFVALDTRDGAIRALVGGFDFTHNKFNHVVQAWRQPGSSFKPFIYSAALEKGFTANTIINDAPISLSSDETGSEPWEPKNYDGGFEGPMTMKRALAKSKNLVSIRILRTITPQFAQKFVERFGFPADKHPAYLPMALGAGAVTPLQLATGYSVFANGGYRIEPYLIKKIVDNQGKILRSSNPKLAGDDSIRVLDARNAFVMDGLLKEVVQNGTAVSAKEKLKRDDLAGKTGTTNNSHDAWFAGYAGHIAGVAWMGFDNPKSLGNKETGGGLSLPIWISYMQTAMLSQPVVERTPPEGLQKVSGEWVYSELVEDNSAIRYVDNDAVSTAAPRRAPRPAPARQNTRDRNDDGGDPSSNDAPPAARAKPMPEPKPNNQVDLLEQVLRPLKQVPARDEAGNIKITPNPQREDGN